ncbi:MAG: hypothetical protein OSB83_12570 [Planctomycetota bacterium]|jgi:hypothetical protein|nr:hypothetical protein [Planctomycetota bacterium]
MYRSAALLLISIALAPALGAETPWEKADYGPCLSFAMDVSEGKLKDTIRFADTRNYVFRARVISLDGARQLNIAYDTELMRVAGAWSGGFLAYGGATKSMGPTPAGKMQFTTGRRPGWSLDGSWDDPREPREGPLPRDVAKYRGVYLHGRSVVVSYTVGDCEVLEMPEGTLVEGRACFTRNFTMGPSKRDLSVLLAEETGALEKNGRLETSVDGAPRGSKLSRKDGLVFLRLPARAGRVSFRITLSRGGEARTAGEKKIADLEAFTRGGPGRWEKTLNTSGKRGEDSGAYALDTLTAPDDNPWGAWLRFSAVDFFADGRAALTTWDGDVWVVSGIGSDREHLKMSWRRYATGLQMPLGIRIVKGKIYTVGRDQLTRLHDIDDDGEADFYENFNNDAGLTLQRHEFVMDLHTDKEGNFYYCRSGHYIKSQRGENCCVMKVSPDGAKLEVFARGFRETNGMSLSPEGRMTIGDNEGNGIPQTPVYELKRGGYYGFEPTMTPNGYKWVVDPICWLPHDFDRSAGGQNWVTSDSWGPMKGALLHTSYGHCSLYRILLDEVEGQLQGLVTKFPLRFESGIMRSRFHPRDGQLYLCGLRGYDTNAVRDGGFYRVRYTGKTLRMPTGWKTRPGGIDISFGCDLDAEFSGNASRWSGQWYDIPRATPREPKRKKAKLPITGVRVLPDRRTVSIDIRDFGPATNISFRYRLKDAEGEMMRGELHGTVNRVPGKDR